MEKITLAGDTIDKNDIDRLIEWLKTYPRLTKGPVTIDYEEKWSKYLNVEHSIFVNSGSSANLLMLSSLVESGLLKAGDSIVVPALSWSTDLAPVLQLGFRPIICDCNLEDLSIDIEHFKNIIRKEKPKALILVSVLGLVPDMEAIVNICNTNDVILIEDACESLGAKFENKHIGSFGYASSFSTYFGHHISTIEGGMVCTNNTDYMNVCKSVRSHGWDRDMDQVYQNKLRSDWKTPDFNAMYTFYYSGYNLRSTDLQAYIGLTQIDKLDNIVKLRNENFYKYYNELKVEWKPKLFDNRQISNFAYPVIHARRAEIVEDLKNNNIEVRPLICGSLGTQPYFVKYNGAPIILRNASLIDSAGFYIPNHAEMTDDQIDKVINIINKYG